MRPVISLISIIWICFTPLFLSADESVALSGFREEVQTVFDETETALADLDDVPDSAIAWIEALRQIAEAAPLGEDPSTWGRSFITANARYLAALDADAATQSLGSAAETIRSMHDRLRSAAMARVTEALGEAEALRIRNEAEAEAKKNPLKELPGTTKSAVDGMFSIGKKLPGIGVGNVTESLNPMASLSRSIDTTTMVLDSYPEKVRSETEVILANPSTKQALDSVERFSHSSVKFAEVSETLPEEIRTTLEQLAEDQPAYQDTIRDVNALVGTTGQTTESINELAATLDQVVRSVAELAAMFPPDPNAPPPPPARTFDIREYESALNELNTTLRETQVILRQVDGLVEKDRVRHYLDEANGTATAIVARIEKAVITISVVICALLLVFVVGFFFIKRNLWMKK